jgi:hypothetical protein
VIAATNTATEASDSAVLNQCITALNKEVMFCNTGAHSYALMKKYLICIQINQRVCLIRLWGDAKLAPTNYAHAKKLYANMFKLRVKFNAQTTAYKIYSLALNSEGTTFGWTPP